MSRQKRSSGPKPAVAFLTQAEAARNLQAKLDALAGVIESIKTRAGDATAEVLIGELPSSLRQFCAWQTGHLTQALPGLPQFGRNASQTLRASASSTARATALLAAVRLLRTERSRRTQQVGEKISAVKKQTLLVQKLQSAAEARLVIALRENQTLQDEVRRLRVQLDSLSNASADALQRKEKQIQQLREKLARLVKPGTTGASPPRPPRARG
ncbi:hypothetical protein [Methylibium petroleiphilum]|uniref:Uncharacterized protein n=1 Tax=Methylibium petroleiphilum (strain ATCC BAA-1232 / LMG 22953 / PM1) TaxID=420662 RepID=A2SF26_METPP|nr:hypothetical protein [Methylibium petroleiphilum]ABM94165.1 hypothetical protein Mpe_A1202 [Methylibium petroleiphilum PM1]ABM96975.1 hypothetical protein Mpe_B0199 [Methylibium petroleiphilum PM1]